jgi:O-antigen/teichoic acid export membrane protein
MQAPSRPDHHARNLFQHVASDVFRIAGATGLAQILAFAAAPLLTRLYTPEAFGHFAFFGALVSILMPLGSMRYEAALPLPTDEGHAHRLLALCLILVACSSLVVTLVISFASPVITQWTGLSGTTIALLPVAIFVLGLHTVLTNWIVRSCAFVQLARVRFSTLAGMVACQLGLGQLHAGVTSLILGFIGGYVVGLILAAYTCSRPLLVATALVDFGGIRRVAAEYRFFPIFTSPAQVINAIGLQLPNLLLPYLYGAGVTGQYSLAQRVLGQPMTLVGQAVNQVYWGNAARLVTHAPAQLWPLFVRLNACLLAFMIPGLALTWIGAEIFTFIFGPAWGQAGSFAGVMIVASLLGLAAQGTTSLHTYRLNHWMCAWEVLHLVLVICAVGAAIQMSWSPMGCIVAITASFAVSNAILLALNGLAARRVSYREHAAAAHTRDRQGAPDTCNPSSSAECEAMGSGATETRPIGAMVVPPRRSVALDLIGAMQNLEGATSARAQDN